MNVVDSSGWLEYFADGPNADFFAPAIEAISDLVVPTISVYEVFTRILQQRRNPFGRRPRRTAKISTLLRIPMADSMILATARAYGATTWTQDEHFAHIEGVQYIAKQAAGG